MTPVPKLSSVVFDCRDARAMARFWSQLLDTEIAVEHSGFIWLKPPNEGAMAIAFQEVPDPTPGKNKLHVDAYHHDLEAIADRVVELGGSVVEPHEVPGFLWTVYADPEGNQFCVGHPADAG